MVSLGENATSKVELSHYKPQIPAPILGPSPSPHPCSVKSVLSPSPFPCRLGWVSGGFLVNFGGLKLLLSPPDFGVGRVSAVSTWSCVATAAEDQVDTAGTRLTSKSGGLRSNLRPPKTPKSLGKPNQGGKGPATEKNGADGAGDGKGDGAILDAGICCFIVGKLHF